MSQRKLPQRVSEIRLEASPSSPRMNGTSGSPRSTPGTPGSGYGSPRSVGSNRSAAVGSPRTPSGSRLSASSSSLGTPANRRSSSGFSPGTPPKMEKVEKLVRTLKSETAIEVDPQTGRPRRASLTPSVFSALKDLVNDVSLTSSKSESIHKQLEKERELKRQVEHWKGVYPALTDDQIKYIFSAFAKAKSKDDPDFLTERSLERLMRKYSIFNPEVVKRVSVLLSNGEGKIFFPEIVKMFNTCLNGSIDEFSEWCFKIYDLNGDGFIDRDEVFTLLSRNLPSEEATKKIDELRQLTDLVMSKFEQINQHRSQQRISLDKFQEFARKHELETELLGKCRVGTANSTRRASSSRLSMTERK